MFSGACAFIVPKVCSTRWWLSTSTCLHNGKAAGQVRCILLENSSLSQRGQDSWPVVEETQRLHPLLFSYFLLGNFDRGTRGTVPSYQISSFLVFGRFPCLLPSSSPALSFSSRTSSIILSIFVPAPVCHRRRRSIVQIG